MAFLSGVARTVVIAATVAGLRATSSSADFADGQIANVFLTRLYEWDSTETAADDGSSVIRPDDVGAGDPGRWVEIVTGGGGGGTPYLTQPDAIEGDSSGGDRNLLSWGVISTDVLGIGDPLNVSTVIEGDVVVLAPTSGVSVVADLVQFDAAATPEISQAAAGAVIGATFRVAAQNNSHASLRAGNLQLAAGANTSTGAHGNVQIEAGGITTQVSHSTHTEFLEPITLGADPATSGDVRLSANGFITTKADGGNTRNLIGYNSTSTRFEVGSDTSTTSTDLRIFASGGGAAIRLVVDGAQRVAVVAASIISLVPEITFATSVASQASITHTAVGDVAGQSMLVRAQGNNSTTHPAGDLVLGGGVNAGSGADGSVLVQTAGVTRVTVAADTTWDGGYLAIGTAPGSGTTATAATGTIRVPRMNPFNNVLVIRNNTDTGDVGLITVSSGANAAFFGGGFGVVGLQIAGTTRFQLTATEAQVTPPILQFVATAVNPIIRQVANASGAGAVGQTTTLQAQDMSGTAARGGKLVLRAGDQTNGSGTARYGGHVLLRPGTGAEEHGNLALLADPASWQSMQRGIFVGDAAAVPTGNPTSGVYIFSEGGAGKGRGASGTTTTFITAEPHCPDCGRDFAHEWESERFGHLAICQWCIVEHLVATTGLTRGIIRREAA